MKPFRFMAGLLIALCVVLPARSETKPIPGHDAPQLRDALELWLSGDDQSSLSAIAALAKSGNKAARIFLGMVERRQNLHSAFVRDLSPEARHHIFRAQNEGGVPKSWLTVEQKNVPVAEAYLLARSPDGGLEGVRRLLMLNEPGQANSLVASVAGNLADLELEDIKLPSRSQFFAWAKAYHTQQVPLILRDQDLDPPQSDNLLHHYLAAAIAPNLNFERSIFIAWQEWYAQDRLVRGSLPGLDQGRRSEEDFLNVLRTAPDLRPLVDFCATNCPSAPDSCLNAGYTANGGLSSLIAFGSPLESLVPTSQLHDSPRGLAMALRNAASMNRVDPNLGDRQNARRSGRTKVVFELDQCFGNLMQTEMTAQQ